MVERRLVACLMECHNDRILLYRFLFLYAVELKNAPEQVPPYFFEPIHCSQLVRQCASIQLVQHLDDNIWLHHFCARRVPRHKLE